uniref:MI domain-containing protein n=1 Tax=Grammatophora oceanica TaxID=210454 RepID=A0A7S1UZL9_9STRA|eukprot:CAMPEP_0194026770 /NCGR_PEP_ID=MMETSP0009_2-20130614/1044_1 /TAXON_ID=210454 /ORGANISM="Grammatophora oceanica, Strain CCMP 410" /LENGTH=557 /DNA_ID=CAMNT_0038665617 /DNA_START=148 /DNA_END=1821 /DNA_ORIENTATION=-
MVEFAKRPEVTVQTMGKVHNPSGQGVRAVSSQVQNKTLKMQQQQKAAAAATPPIPTKVETTNTTHHHDTKVKEEGSSRRNIVRKKTTAADGNYDSRNKKQGGHGKGQWNHDQLSSYYAEEEELPMDRKDPLYDETKDRFILTSGSTAVVDNPVVAALDGGGDADPIIAGKNGYHAPTNKAIYGPLLTLPEFKIRLAETLKEYFDSADAEEVVRSLDELKCRLYHPEIVKKAISLALDEGPRECELISKLFCCLLGGDIVVATTATTASDGGTGPSTATTPEAVDVVDPPAAAATTTTTTIRSGAAVAPLTRQEMEMGFEIVLDSLDDLEIDIPDAKTMVASFLARAVVDEVLTPAFLSQVNNSRPGNIVVEKAVSLLTREHSTARLERVWGPGDGRPVPELKASVDQLLQEYLSSRELDEAARCVKELQAPHFHHELVKRGVVHAMEAEVDPTASLDAMVALLTFLVDNAIVSEVQVQKGVRRLHSLLGDIALDVPAAPQLLEEFETMARDRGLSLSPSSSSAKEGTPEEDGTTTTTMKNGENGKHVVEPTAEGTSS